MSEKDTYQLDATLSKNITNVLTVPISLYQIAGSLTEAQKFIILERMGHDGLKDLDDLPPSVTYMIEKVQDMTPDEAVDVLKEAIIMHEDDVNYPAEDYENIKKLVEESSLNLEEESSSREEKKGSSGDEAIGEVSDWDLQVRLEACLIQYFSPYPEVRAVTDPYDPDMPVETIRSYFLALLWTVIGSFVNEFFTHRQPPISLSTPVIQLFLYPSGKLWEMIFPDWGFTIRGTRISMNPGPWSYKEQMFATILYSVSSTPPYVDSNIIVQKLPMFFNNNWVTFGYQFLLMISTQCMGFGFAGLLRKFAIYPVRAIWPTILPTLALNKALLAPEKKENIHGWRISRYQFFFGVTAFSFIYNWVPEYLFGALSTFNWMTWIKPGNFDLAVVTGSILGMGINPVTTFDWNIIDFNLCLTLPFYSQLNQYIGYFIGTMGIFGLFYSNYYWSSYLPINDNSVYTNTGEIYEVTQILDDGGLFDPVRYQQYGPPFYTAGNLLCYGAYFASYPFAFFYTMINEWKTFKASFLDVWGSLKNIRGSKSNYANYNDPHCKMMSKYKEVPDWWFFTIMLISVVLMIILVEVFKGTKTPVWAIFFCLAINFIFLIPFTSILAVTGFSMGLNVLVELIVGYALPGNGVALMTLKALGYNIGGQASNYVSDQKLAHYSRIPPRAIFRGQLISTIVSCFVTLGVLQFLLHGIKDFCMPQQSQKFSCPGDTTYYTAAVFWGVIGPKKVFGGLYPMFQWCFLIGFLLVFPCLAIKKWGPKKLVAYFQPTLVIGGMLNFAPYNISYYTMGMYMSFIFMYYIRKHYIAWWKKYNYVFTAAMGSGVAFSAVIIFFAVQFHEKDVNWWGNSVYNDGIDNYNGQVSLLDPATAPDGYFGPRRGHFP